MGSVRGRVVSVSPGLIDDTIMGRSAAVGIGGYATGSAVGRAGKGAEIAAVVAFLCSPAASYVTRGDLLVDGGLRGTQRQSA